MVISLAAALKTAILLLTVGTGMSKRNQVLITVRGGVAEVVHKPADVEVVFRDYDIQGVEAMGWKRDADGEQYLEAVRPATRRQK